MPDIPEIAFTTLPEQRHTDDMQDIITAVPSWILRWGITIFFTVLVLIVVLSASINYPDLVKTNMQIGSPNAPKSIVSKTAGKLVKLLAQENSEVVAGKPLAYLESTANHAKVLSLLANLKVLQGELLNNKPLHNINNKDDNPQFGELQTAYQTFYGEYINYIASVENGFLLKKREFLKNDLNFLAQQQQQLGLQKNLQQKDFSLAEEEYRMHKKLTQDKVETTAELRQEESKYLAKKAPLLQTESAMITGNNNFAAKQKEILELDNQIQEEKSKQALNSLISTTEDWKNRYVLSASQSGKLTYAGIIQENQVLTQGQEIFYINPGNEQFFGSMAIPQNNMGKVKVGQQVLIKLRSYPFEEYGMIRGKIKYIADVPYRDSIFISRVEFNIKNSTDLKKPVHLKQGMMADAEIITLNATILQRLVRSFIKVTGNR
jgi:HlyD family secretion protein